MNRISRTLLLLVVFQSYVGIGLIYPIFSTLFFDPDSAFFPAHTSASARGMWLGIILAMTPLIQLLGSPYMGSYSDKKGRKKALLICLTMGILGYALSIVGLYKTSLMIILLSRVFIGICGCSACVAQAALYDVSKDAKAFALFNMVMGAGFTLGPFLGGKLTDENFSSMISVTLPFWVLLVSLVILLGIMMVLFSSAKPLPQVDSLVNLHPTRELFKTGRIRTLFICAFIFSFGWSYFFEFIPVYLIGQYKFKASMIGNFYAYSGAMYAISCGVLIKPLIKRVPLTHLLFLSLLLAGVYSYIFLFIENQNYIWVYAPFLLFLVSVIYPVITALLAKEASQEILGKVLGVLQSVQSLAFALSPLVSGVLISLHIAMPIFLGGGTMLLAAAVFALSSYVRQVR
jgi:MFS transporter, DHA1 family, tetracycline resistance protein